MAERICICGPSGSGKSTAIATLSPETTFINNTLAKRLPWRGSGKVYNKDSKNYTAFEKYDQIIALLKKISRDMPHIQTIVLDDIGHVMVKEAFARIKESGYGKFTDMGKHMFEIFDTAQTLRDDLTVVFMFHTSREIQEGYEPTLKIKTIGKVLDSWFNPNEAFDVVLYTDVKQTQEGVEYNFVTNKWGEYDAKSPMGMFDIRIPNDLNLVINKLKTYYDG